MDLLAFAKTRYSVRKFSDKPVEKDKPDLIVEAGKIAPAAINYQSQRILILNTPDSIEKMKHSYSYLINPPVALLICCFKGKCKKPLRLTGFWNCGCNHFRQYWLLGFFYPLSERGIIKYKNKASLFQIETLI